MFSEHVQYFRARQATSEKPNRLNDNMYIADLIPKGLKGSVGGYVSESKTLLAPTMKIW